MGQVKFFFGSSLGLFLKTYENHIALPYRASLVAIEPSLRERYVKLMGELVPRGGRVLLVTISYDSKKASGPPFSVPPEEVQS